jgi:predicted nucleotidyltransferase component of viral defense system
VNEFFTVRVDSEYDIAANKLMALVDRFDPKDCVDLYFLLQKFLL